MESEEIIQQHIDSVLKSTKVKTTGKMIIKSVWLFLKNLILFLKECFVYLAYFRVKIPCLGLAVEVAIIMLVGFFPSVYFYTRSKMAEDQASKIKYEVEDSMRQEVIYAETQGWARGRKEVHDSLDRDREKAELIQKQKAAAWAAKARAAQQERENNEKEQTNQEQ